jgi:predicted PurR-regulated permease PerM
MPYVDHIKTAGGALKRWFIGTLQDAAAVAAMWLIGLWIVGVPWAPAWAVLGGLFQFVPNFGPVLALIGPAMALLFTEADGMKFIYLLIVFAAVALLDGLVVGPYFQRRQNRVPIWASIVTPIVLGILIPFWGVLLAPPLLAVVYTFRSKSAQIQKQIDELQAEQARLAAEAQRRGSSDNENDGRK